MSAQKRISLGRFDADYRKRWDIACLAGVDEAGRGCLAGPVVAAAVILEPGRVLRGLNDSKQLSAVKRDALFETICSRAVALSIGWASAEEIDRVNILQATHLAALRALALLRPVPQGILTDFLKLETPGATPLDAIVKGDARSQSVAAASIIAKVTRDRWLTRLDAEYPGYGLAKHKGYGTPEHIAAIQRLGSSTLHRQTFAGVSWFDAELRLSLSCQSLLESGESEDLTPNEALGLWTRADACLPECEEALLRKTFGLRKTLVSRRKVPHDES